MNNISYSLGRSVLASLFLASAQMAEAQTTYYWDSNGASPGAGTTPAGTWGGPSDSAFWGTSATGTSATSSTGPGASDTAVFTAFNTAADSPTTGAYTVTLGANESIYALVIGSSVTSTTGGILTLAGNGSGLSIGAGGITLNGSDGDVTFASSIGTVTLTANQTWATNNAHVINMQANVAGTASTGNTETLTLGYSAAFAPTISGIISDGSGGGSLGLTVNNTNGLVTGGGTWNITGTANTFSGPTTISQGVLEIASLTNVGGGASSLGSVTTTANGTINMGSSTSPASLVYLGTAASTSNRIINLTGSNVTIANNATASTSSLTLTSANGNTAGTATLTFSGSNTGSNTFSGTLNDGSGQLNLAKTGTGAWYLSGNNTFTGNVAMSAGTMVMNGSNSFNNVTVSGGTLTLGGANFSFGNYTVTGGALNINGNNDGIGGLSISGGGLVTMGSGGTAGFGNIAINGGYLLISSGANVSENSSIAIGSSGGGIGVSYTPSGDFPFVSDSSGTLGGVFGIGYSGTGGIGSDPNVNALFTSSSYWSVGAFAGTSGTYTGSSLPVGANNTYRIGGGGGTLALQNAVLTGAGNNVQIGNASSGGTVVIPGGETYTGTTTILNGTASIASGSSFGTGSSAIILGSGANNVGINYAGPGETFSRPLNFAGTTGTVTLSNSGTGNINYSGTPTFSGSGNKSLILGNPTDTFGGSLGAITNGPTGTTTVTVNAGNNAVWALTGGSGNTYTGATTINSGVLQTTNATDLANSFVNLNGSLPPTNNPLYAIWQSQGTLNANLGTSGAGNIGWGTYSGFAAKGGSFTITLNGGAQLVWGTGNFMGTGVAPMVLGSTTADSQVVLTNPINLNTADVFNRVIYVQKGTGTDSALLSGVLSSGTGTASATGITKQGPGMLILSGANTFSGLVDVSQGTLVAGTNSPAAGASTVGAFGSGYGPSSGGSPTEATIQVGDGNTGTATNPSVLIGGAYTVARPASFLDDGVNNVYSIGGNTSSTSTWSGPVTFTNSGGHGNSFAVTQAAGGTFNLSGGLSAGGAGTSTLTFANTGAVNVNTTGISNGGGTVAVTQTGTGTTTLAVASTYTGNTTISAGVLQLGNTLAAQSSNVTIGAANGLGFSSGIGAFTIGALNGSVNEALTDAGGSGVALTVGNNNASGTYTGVLGGLGGVVKAGTGTETLTGNNTYQGATTVSGGTLQVGNGTSGSLGAGTATVNSGGTLLFNEANGSTFAGNLSDSGAVGGAESTGVTNTLSGVISGSGGFSQTGTGTTVVTNANTFNGATTISAGAVQLGNTNAFQNSSIALGVANGLTFSSGIHSFTVGALTGASNEALVDTASTAVALTVGNNNASGTYTGALSGAGSIVKAGTGTETLSGANTFTGGTTVNVGALTLGSTTALGATTNTLTINGGTVNLNGNATTVATLSGSGGTLDDGAVASDTLTVNGSGTGTYSGNIANGGTGIFGLTKSGTGTLVLNGNDSYTGATSLSAGTLVLGGNNTTTAALTATGGTLVINSNTALGSGGLTLSSATVGLDSTVSGVATTTSQVWTTGGGSGTTINFAGTNNLTIGAGSFNITLGNLTINTAQNTLTLGAILTGANRNFSKTGSGTLVLAGAGTLSGATITFGGGVTEVTAAETPGTSGPLGKVSSNTLVFSGGTLEYSSTNTTDYSPRIAAGTSTGAVSINTNGQNVTFGTALTANQSGGLTKLGTGTLTLSVANNYGGTTTIGNGTVATGTVGAFGTSSTLNLGVASTSSGVLNYTGGTGTLTKNISALGNGGDTIQNSGTGALTLSGTLTKSNTVLTLNGGANGINVTGQITGGTTSNFNSDLNVTGGVITLSNANNNYTGPTSIYNAGTLKDGVSNAVPVGSVLNLGNASDGAVTNTYDLNGFNQTVAALNSTSNGGSTNSNIVTNSGASGTNTLTLSGVNSDSAPVNGSFGGVIRNGTNAATALTVTGGVQALGGANTYTGATTVASGTLNVTGSLASGSSVVVGNNTGVALLEGSGTVNGALSTVTTGSNIAYVAPGAVGAVGTLHVGSLGFTIGAGTQFDFDLNTSNAIGGVSNDLIAMSGGVLTIGGSGIIFNFDQLTNLTPGVAYTLINGAGSISGFSATDFSAAGIGSDTATFTMSGGSLLVTFTAPSANYYFTGGNSNSFTDPGNYYSQASGGTQQSAALSSTGNVFLNATSPTPQNTPDTLNTSASINSLTFVSGGTSVAGSGTLTLAGTGTAGITDSAGVAGNTETVSPSVVLGANQTWTATANSTLNVTGAVSGAHSLAITGAGTTKLGGANTFQGLTVGTGSDSPTLLLVNGTNGSATGTTTLVVNAGATLGGTGKSSGTSFSISGGGTAPGARANVLVGLNSASDTSVSTTLALQATGASTIQNANLTFNLNSAVAGGLGTNPANSGTELLVGATPITFGSGAQSTVLTLNLEGTNIIGLNTPYVLISGLTAGGINQYTGLSLGTSTGSLATGLITPILNSGNGGTGNLVLSLSGNAATFYGANTYLFLYQNSTTGADDIEVEVIPEPGTWALMLGGLAALILWQRRKNQS